MLTNGKGDDVSVRTQWTGSLYDSSYYFNPYMEKYRQEGQMKFPFFLTPQKHYVGAAWYKRTIYVPRDWKDQRITLFLERPHIETTVYVNGREVGHQLSLSTPHRYDVTRAIKAGRKNEILIRVYNGIENVCVGQDSHSVTDQTQGNWNGITGRMELQPHWKKLNIKSFQLQTDSAGTHMIVNLENHVDGVRIMPFWDYDVTVTLTPLSGRNAGKMVYKNALPAQGDKIEFRHRDDDLHALGRVQALTLSADRRGRRRCLRDQLRPARHQSSRASALHQQASALPARNGRELLLPRDGLSAHDRRRVAAHLPQVQGVWAQPRALPQLLPARGRLCRCRPRGHLPAARRSVVAQPRREAAPRTED